MLGLAKRVSARILLASTSEVYGDPDIHPQHEEYNGNVNCTGLRACYDEGKRVAETLAFEYHREHQTDIRVARIFNTYGPRMSENDGRVVSNLIVQALQNKFLTIYGDGTQTRSFCYISDMAEGLIKLMNGNYIGPINLGNPDEYTILELATIIHKMTKSNAQLIYKELPKDDPKKRQPDITKAKFHLDWQPQFSLERGLELTIQHFQDQLFE